MTATLPEKKEKEEKTLKQQEAEKLAQEASENLQRARKIMANMTRQRRAVVQNQSQIVYERR
jgi:hypothetical protein